MGQRGFYRSGDGVSHYNTFSGADPADSLLSDGTATYTPGISEHRTSDNSSHYYTSDYLGTLRNLRDSSGGISEDSRYDGFGVVAYKQNAPTTPFGFAGAQGYHTDYQDSNLLLLGNRFYDVGVGRFLSQDPIGDGDNWYAYCGNDPLDCTDPSGLWPTSIDGIAIGGEEFRHAGAPGSPNDIGLPGHWAFGDYQGRTITPQYTDANGILHGGRTEHYGLNWVVNNEDIENWADQNLTFGLAERAGRLEGLADAGRGSRAAANTATLGLVGAIGLAAFTRGEGEKGAVVIGESMARVNAAAREFGAEVYNPGEFISEEISLSKNAEWIRNLMKEGRTIIDIGHDPGRPSTPSIYYNMEKDLTADYKNLMFKPQ